MSKNDRRGVALAIAKELQNTIAPLRISDQAGVTVIDSSPGRIEVTSDGIAVTTKRGVSAGWTHKESCSPEYSAMRCSLLLQSVS